MKKKRGRIAWVLAYLSGAIALAFLVMALTSWARYTTVGIDSDADDAPFVYYSYYRVRWPGDGSFRLVAGAFRYVRAPSYVLEPFDLGGRFFLVPRRDPSYNFWGRVGFSLHSATWEDERTKTDTSARKPWESWIGVPSLLPAAIFALPFFLYVRRQKRERSHAA